jgi:glutamine synthetase
MRSSERLAAYLEDTQSRFATVAMTDTNCLLRGQIVSAASLPGIFEHGMGMAPPVLALDPTGEILAMPSVTDGAADFHDDPLEVDEASARSLPFAKPGHDLLPHSQYRDESSALCPRSLLTRVHNRAAKAGFSPKYGLELEYTLFDETHESAKPKGYRDLKTATLHKSHDLLIYQAAQSEWYEAVAAMC